MENQTPQNFSAPRHWIAPEELNSSYWADSKNVEKRGQEFHDKPVEAIALIDKLDTKGLARREFLTIMGASMAMLTRRRMRDALIKTERCSMAAVRARLLWEHTSREENKKVVHTPQQLF